MPKTKKAARKPSQPWVTEAYREHMAEIGRSGGQSRSQRKNKASKKNLKKAMAAKFPNSAKHQLPNS